MYDCIVIGAGIAGMTASIYLKRANKKVLLIEKETIGGQIASSLLVSNYPGFKNISGPSLVSNIYDQILDLDIPLEIEEVKEIVDGKLKKVITNYNTYETKTIIIATGAKYRNLNILSEEKFIGNGIHFCVACDGAFYKDKVVAVIGGGSSALVNAISLSDICKTVYLIQNLNNLTGEVVLQEKLKEKNNVIILTNSFVKKIIGENKIEKISIETKDGVKDIIIDGMFISIGFVPQNEIFKNLITLDSNNYILSDDCTTNIEGIFVSGDCRTKEYRQLTTASSDGTVAALKVIDYLSK